MEDGAQPDEEDENDGDADPCQIHDGAARFKPAAAPDQHEAPAAPALALRVGALSLCVRVAQEPDTSREDSSS